MDRPLRRLTRLSLAALTAATAFVAVALWLSIVHDLVPYEADVRIPWWALAGGFAVTERFVVHAHVRGSAHSLSLSEIPLVLGLLLADPSDVTIAAVAGPALVLIFTRGHGLTRLLFNLSQYALTAALATVILHTLVPTADVIGPPVWLATLGAVCVSSTAAAVLVFCAIGLHEGGIPSRRLAGMMGVDLGVSLTNACVALAGATIVANDLMAAWLLVPPATMLLIAYRAYSSEQAKHRSLEFLYGVTRTLSNGNDLEPELLDLMRRTRTSFRVRTAETVLLSGDGGLRTGLSADGPDEVMTAVGAADASALRHAVQASHAVIVDRDDCASELEHYLEARGIVQALIAPVRSETGLAGVMVLGDRIGAEPEFADEDLRLIEALATHAGFSLELDRLEREAQSDALTGLANRTLFQRRVEASLARPSGSATVLFLDLDDFKAINDRAGHAAGDAVLVAAASRIEAAVRPDDVAARFGGDEFAVLLEDVDDHHGEQVAGRILDLFAAPVTVDGESTWVRSSVGIATASAGSLGADQLLRQADIAMYRAKEAGKSQVRVWFPEMQPAAESGETGRGELAAALELGEVVAHFQPIVSLEDGSVVAVEALARWRHPRRGLVGAASFVRDADPDLMAAVDREVLAQACAMAARGDAPAVHVNVAALDAATVRDVIAASGVEPDRLVLELSERALASAPDSALSALRAIGVRIAFDDFGSGRRALEVLRSRPVDIVKVAHAYVEDAGRGPHDRAMLSMIVQIGSMYGLQVIAQGIEREDQREALADLGCELGQGYLLGRPLPQVAVASRTAVS